jgi:hypothetical protein
MLSRTLITLPFLAGILSGFLGAQTTPEPSDAPIAVFTTALYNDQANLKEPSDSAMAGVATAVLRTRLSDRLGEQVRPFGETDSAAATPDARELAGSVNCNVKVACALAVAGSEGARWVVLSKVSKTSNLIWLLSAQLIRVTTGEIVLDDSTELKGEPEAMIRVGMRIFADRVVRTVRAGGVATDFPS